MSVTHDHLYIINAKQDHVLLSYCTMQYYNAKEIYTTQLKFIKHHTEDVTIGSYSSGWMPVLCSLRYCTSQKEHSTGIQPLETDSVTGDICVQRYASLTLKCLIVIAGSVKPVLFAGTSASFAASELSAPYLAILATSLLPCDIVATCVSVYSTRKPRPHQMHMCGSWKSVRGVSQTGFFPSSCQCVSIPQVRIQS